jgi:hypothetical protein
LFAHRIAVIGLQNVIAERVRRHKPRSALRRELRQWRTRELGAAVD